MPVVTFVDAFACVSAFARVDAFACVSAFTRVDAFACVGAFTRAATRLERRAVCGRLWLRATRLLAPALSQAAAAQEPV